MAKEGEVKDDKVSELEGKLEKLTGAVSTMLEGFQTMQEQNTSLIEQMKNFTAPRSKEDDEDEDDADVEQMSRSEFQNHLLKQVEKVVKNQVEPINQNLNDFQGKVTEKTVAEEIKGFAAEHKDFWYYKDEIGALAKENPELSIGRLYALAKSENPDKVEEVDAKLAEEEGEGKSKEDEGFGGLTPTSGGRSDKPTDMDMKTAGDTAWNETMAGLEKNGVLNEG